MKLPVLLEKLYLEIHTYGMPTQLSLSGEYALKEWDICLCFGREGRNLKSRAMSGKVGLDRESSLLALGSKEMISSRVWIIWLFLLYL